MDFRDIEVLGTRRSADEIASANRFVSVMLHNGASYTAAVAHVQFHKALVDVAFADIIQSMTAHIHAVKLHHGERGILRCVQTAEHTSGQTETAFHGGFQRRFFMRCQRNILQPEDLFQLVKCEHGVYIGVILFLLSGDTSADVNDFCIGHPAFDILRMCNHGRNHRSQTWNKLRIVFLNQGNHGRAGRGYNDIIFAFGYQHVIVFFYDCGANGRFFHSSESDRFQSLRNTGKSDSEKCRERRIDAGNYRAFALLDQNFSYFFSIHDALCIMWAHAIAFSAEHTHVADNVCLMAGISDRLSGTIPDTAMAVSAICFHKLNNIRHEKQPPS